MAAWSEVEYVLFLNTFLMVGWSSLAMFGLWPFRGLFHSWIFVNHYYSWTLHVMMVWFEAGCIGLFALNLQALITFNDATGDEAYHMVFVTNVLMHSIWGIHNLHQFVRKMRKQDEGTVNQLRRPYPMLMCSVVGACGSASVRNIYALVVPPEELNMAFIIAMWVWEWLSLLVNVLDFVYYLTNEFEFEEWGGNVTSDADTMEQIVASASKPMPRSPDSPQMPSSTA